MFFFTTSCFGIVDGKAFLTFSYQYAHIFSFEFIFIMEIFNPVLNEGFSMVFKISVTSCSVISA